MSNPRTTQDRVLAAAIQANIPVCLWSEPGTGKTAMVKAVAANLGIPFAVIDLTMCGEPADLAGIPVVKADGIHYEARAWARNVAAQDGPALLLVDEIGSADPAVAAAAMPVVHERMVGDLYLGDQVRVVLAGNPPENAANGFEIPAPLANRMLHLDFNGLNIDDWTLGLIAGWDTVTPDIALGVDASDSARMNAAMTVASFIKKVPDQLQACPDNPAKQCKPWPSRRSWENVARILPFVHDDDIITAVSGLVGKEAGTKFNHHLEYADLVAPKDLLADFSLLDWNDRADRVHAALTGVVAWVHMTGSKRDYAKAWKLLAEADKHQRLHVAGAAAVRLSKAAPKGATVPAEAAMFADALSGSPLLAAA